MSIVLDDTDRWERDPDWAHPDEYTVDDNWRTGFEVAR